MKTALFDSGSTNLHFALWDGNNLVKTSVFPYPEDEDGLRILIAHILNENEPDNAAAVSVSLKWRERLFSAINEVLPGKLSIARYASDIGIHVEYDRQESYGIDRALAAFGAFRYFRDSCVVIDSGTAITFDMVDKKGNITGGFIFPGYAALASSLTEKTDLPDVSFSNKKCPGNSTVSVMENGFCAGFSAAVNALVKISGEYSGASDRIILTGGGTDILKKCLELPFIEKKDLVLESLGLVSGMLPKYP